MGGSTTTAGAVVVDAQVNLMATAIARAHGGSGSRSAGRGVRGAHDGNGATVSLSDAQKDALLTGAVFAADGNHEGCSTR